MKKLMRSRINAILSDYDGTLSPTRTIRSNMESIPKQLEGILWEMLKQSLSVLSQVKIIILYNKAKFAWVFSCIMGIETIVLRMPKEIENGSNTEDNLNCIKERYLFPNIENILKTNSVTLSKLAENIESEFKADVIVQRKHTSDGKCLAGITIDYRHLDWKLIKNELEPSLNEIIQKYKSLSSSKLISNLHIQMYRSHPFLDVYSTYCDKGMAFDLITGNILKSKDNGEMDILYLGDSENDNPAFRKASISVGIISDKSLNPKLDCQYLIDYEHLPKFLGHLADNKFVFSERFLNL